MDVNRIGRGILGNALARLHGLDELNAVGSLAPEIMPTVSIWERPEFWALVGGSLGVCRVFMIGGTGGSYQKARLYNPPKSGVLVIVEELIPSTGSRIHYGLQQSDLGNYVASNVFHRDSRRVWAGNVNTGLAAQLGILGSVSSSGVIHGENAGEQPLTLNYILAPGWSIHLQGDAEADLAFTLHWRERSAGADELSVL